MAIIRFLILSLALLASTFGADTDLVGLIQIDSSGVPRAVNPITGSANVGKSLIFGSDGKIGPVDVLTQSEWTTQRSTLDTQLAAKAATSHTHTLSQLSDITATGTALASASSASAARTALGLGSLATASGVTASQITDSTTIGRSILTGVDAAAIRSALGLGSLETAAATAQSAAEAAQDAAELADWYGTEAAVMSLRPAMWLAPDSIVLSGAQAVTPAALAWKDKSGRGNHATQSTSGSRPTWTADGINGFPAMQFGSGKSMTIPALPWVEAFVVGTVDTPGLTMICGDSASAYWVALGGAGYASNGFASGSSESLIGHSRTFSAGTHLFSYGRKPFAANKNVNATAYQWVRGIDGAELRTTCTFPDLQPTKLGAYSGWYYGGKIAEVLVFDRALTERARDSVTAYLTTKYGTTWAGGGFLLALGDSNTQGYNMSMAQAWPGVLLGTTSGAGLLGNTWNGYIAARGGNNGADMLADAGWQGVASGRRKCVAWVVSSLNDVTNGATAAQSAAAWKAVCRSYKNAGWRVGVSYAPPRTGIDEAVRTEFNAAVATWDEDGTVDVVYPGSDATLFAAGQNTNLTWYQDGTHWTVAGQARFAADIQASIESIAGMAQLTPPGRPTAEGAPLDLTGTGVTGTLPVANGGTGQTTASNGQLLIGNGSGFSKATLTAGSGVTITNGSGTITIAATGGGLGGGTGSVDNAITRADGTGAATLQGSDVALNDSTTSTTAQVGLANIHSGQTNSALYLSPKGTGAFWLGPAATGSSTTGNARGTSSVDLQLIRNAATQVPSGSESFAAGSYNTVSGSHSAAVGYVLVASGDYSFAANYDNTASGSNSSAFGYRSNATHMGEMAIGGGRRSVAGDAQTSVVTAFGTTTNNTATEIYLNGANSRLTVPSGHCYACDIRWVAKSGANVAAGKRFCVINNNSGTTALDGTVDTIGTDHTTLAVGGISLTAIDSTTDYLEIKVTGITSTTIYWVVTINFTIVG